MTWLAKQHFFREKVLNLGYVSTYFDSIMRRSGVGILGKATLSNVF